MLKPPYIVEASDTWVSGLVAARYGAFVPQLRAWFECGDCGVWHMGDRPRTRSPQARRHFRTCDACLGRGVCADCGDTFSRLRKSQRFCSAGCKARAKDRRRREREIAGRPRFSRECQHCGADFETVYAAKKFCDKPCQKAAAKKRQLRSVSIQRGYRDALKRGVVAERVDRRVVFERDGGVCYLCGEVADPADWHLEHVVPLSRGGPHTYENVRVSHPACNLAKSDSLLEAG